MAKPAKKRIGRPPGRRAPHRPVVSARVPQADYDEIVAAARASKRTMAEEVFWRVRKSFEAEKAQADARAILARANETAKQIVKQEVEGVLRQAGYTQVHGMDGAAWFEPGVASIKWIADTLPQGLLEELFTRAAARAVKLTLKGEQP
jgi:hypothetical protein